MLEGAGHPYGSRRDPARGSRRRWYFGSAVNNFGIQLLLDGFLHDAVPPAPRRAVGIVPSLGGTVPSTAQSWRRGEDTARQNRVSYR